MAFGGIQAVGDDQEWKAEAERRIKELERLVQALIANNKGR